MNGTDCLGCEASFVRDLDKDILIVRDVWSRWNHRDVNGKYLSSFGLCHHFLLWSCNYLSWFLSALLSLRFLDIWSRGLPLITSVFLNFCKNVDQQQQKQVSYGMKPILNIRYEIFKHWKLGFHWQFLQVL